MKHLRNLRKIIVGDNYHNAIKYIKGNDYFLGKHRGKITSILPSKEDPRLVDIYVQIEEDNVYWKSVLVENIIDFEQDVNFE